MERAGKALWKALHAELDDSAEFDARELALIEPACRCADEIAKLEEVLATDGVTTTGSKGQVVVHPALSEVRQARLALLRLLSPLEFGDAAVQLALGTSVSSIASVRARKAARARWDGKADPRG